MIFIVLGTQKFQLNRLLQMVDGYVEQGKLSEEIIAQRGNSDYVPKNFKSYDFLDKETFDQLIEKADMVITHSGVGSIITALKSKRPVIVFPRLKKYKEHVDDHQLDIAEAFAKKGYVLCCQDGEELLDYIEEAKTKTFAEYHSQRERVVETIQQFLNKTDKLEA